MCKPNSKIYLCTCASVSKKPFPVTNPKEVDMGEYEKPNFIWTLYKYQGEKDSFMVGEMVMPVESLDTELSSEYLIQQLNSKNRFDFNYEPIEGDNLQIKKEYIYKSIKGFTRTDLYEYMSFIYREGKWQEEVYDVFSDKIKSFKKGKIKYIPQEGISIS